MSEVSNSEAAPTGEGQIHIDTVNQDFTREELREFAARLPEMIQEAKNMEAYMRDRIEKFTFRFKGRVIFRLPVISNPEVWSEEIPRRIKYLEDAQAEVQGKLG